MFKHKSLIYDFSFGLDFREQLLKDDFPKAKAENSRQRWLVIKKRVNDWYKKVSLEFY